MTALLLSLLTQPAHATETAWMVIASGSTDRGEAEDQLIGFQQDGLPGNATHPRLVDSSTVTGLNPGFHVVVAATVDDEATARQMAEALNTYTTGVYVREVTVDGPERVRCDQGDNRCRARVTDPWRMVVPFDFGGGEADPAFRSAYEAVQTAGAERRYHVVLPADASAQVGVPGTTDAVDLSPLIQPGRYGFFVQMQGYDAQFVPVAAPSVVVEEIRLYFTGM